MSEAGHILGIDIGGTFTDVLAFDLDAGVLSAAKVPTVPGSLVDGIVAGVEELGLELGAVSRIVHGSTTCTNALIEGTQAPTGFIGTRGFSDEFDIQRMVRRWAKTPRAAIYDLHQVKPAPFVPRRLRREVDERTLFSGEIAEPLDTGQLDEAARALTAQGAEAIAICFLWSPVNDAHEREAKGEEAESHCQAHTYGHVRGPVETPAKAADQVHDRVKQTEGAPRGWQHVDRIEGATQESQRRDHQHGDKL